MDPSEIRSLRARLGWSLEEMARALGVTAGAVGHWERGLHAPHALVTATLELWRRQLDRTDAARRERANQELLAAVLTGGAIALLTWLTTQPYDDDPR